MYIYTECKCGLLKRAVIEHSEELTMHLRPYDATARNGHQVAPLCQLCQQVQLFSALLFNGSSLLHIVFYTKGINYP